MQTLAGMKDANSMTGVTIDSERCKGCLLCIDVCPEHMLVQSEAIGSAGYHYVVASDPDDCIGCGLCAVMCPDSAISVVKDGRQVAAKPETIYEQSSTYCPGCSHGIVHRLIAEIIDEKELRADTIGITPIGCSIFIYRVIDIDFIEGAHGRAPAVATGVKRVHPDKVVFTYQGDGDISAIGLSEIMHTAIRNENISVFFVNNGNYGMTGGQAAPTTLLGQVTTSTPKGKQASEGRPVKMAELLAQVSSDSAYIARGAADTPKNVNRVKKYIRKAIEHQQSKLGFSLVEVLGTCPTNWKMTQAESLEWVSGPMTEAFPIGEIKIPKEDASRG